MSTGNSTSTPLASGATFTGTSENITDYAETSINLYALPAGATGTLYFEYSPDNVNWDVSVPLVVSAPSSTPPIPLRTVLPFFRVRYVNDLVVQTAFRLTTVYHVYSGKDLTRFLNQTITNAEPVEMHASVIKGLSTDTTYKSVTSTPSGSGHQPLDVALYDGAGNQLTAFAGDRQIDLLTWILIELRVVTSFLQTGLNIQDDVDKIRNDSTILS